MKYVALLYMVAIAVYNLIGDNSIIYWRVFYFFFVHLTLTFCFYDLWRKEILKTTKALYLAGFIFSCFYTIFQILTLCSGTVARYMGMINSALWSSIIVILVLILLWLAYDKNGERKTD